MKLLGEGCNTGHGNLDKEEKEGLKSLQKWINSGELVVAQADKSGKFCILTRDQYLTAAEVHIKNDKEIGLEESKMIENTLNGYMRWWAEMTHLSDNWDQRDRSVKNLLHQSRSII